MAKSFMGGSKQALDDDRIKNALKTELQGLEVSKELYKRTISKITDELDKERVPILPKVINKLVYRYAATFAACLLVVVLALSYNRIMPGFQANNDKKEATSLESGMITGVRYNKSTSVDSADSDGEDINQNYRSSAAPSERPEPEEAQADLSLALTTFTGERSLKSIDFGAADQSKDMGGRDEFSFKDITSEYNIKNKTDYYFEDGSAINVSMLMSEGATSCLLESVESVNELLSGQSYWIMPLANRKGDIEALLPVEDDKVSVKSFYDHNQGTSSANNAMTIDQGLLRLLFNREDLERRFIDKLNVKNVDWLVIVDINAANDFLVFVGTDVKEYAMPVFSTISVESLKNGEIYNAQEVFSSLSQYLEP